MRHVGELKTLTRKGAENVSVTLPEDANKSLTVIRAINAAGEKLPLWVILKGSTDRSKEKIRDRLRRGICDREMPLMISHTENGCATPELMERYLKWLSNKNG